uniref:Uncharacterized protein n=1 Tax=Rhizophagus irregularis (strain DAOM 181602 / DAOM 197198 / MUCL 43194) TaxID=747089 RepID=U9T3E3_RHIID
MYHEQSSEPLYLFFAYNNKKIFLAKVISVNNCSCTHDFYCELTGFLGKSLVDEEIMDGSFPEEV